MTKQVSKAKARVDFFVTIHKMHWWRLVAANGIIMITSRAFKSKKNAQTNLKAVLRALQQYDMEGGK